VWLRAHADTSTDASTDAGTNVSRYFGL